MRCLVWFGAGVYLLTKYILLYERFFFGLLVYDTVPILHLISSLGTILDYFPPSSSAPSFFLISTYSFIPHLVSRIPCPLNFLSLIFDIQYVFDLLSYTLLSVFFLDFSSVPTYPVCVCLYFTISLSLSTSLYFSLHIHSSIASLGYSSSSSFPLPRSNPYSGFFFSLPYGLGLIRWLLWGVRVSN